MHFRVESCRCRKILEHWTLSHQPASQCSQSLPTTDELITNINRLEYNSQLKMSPFSVFQKRGKNFTKIILPKDDFCKIVFFINTCDLDVSENEGFYLSFKFSWERLHVWFSPWTRIFFSHKTKIRSFFDIKKTITFFQMLPKFHIETAGSQYFFVCASFRLIDFFLYNLATGKYIDIPPLLINGGSLNNTKLLV